MGRWGEASKGGKGEKRGGEDMRRERQGRGRERRTRKEKKKEERRESRKEKRREKKRLGRGEEERRLERRGGIMIIGNREMDIFWFLTIKTPSERFEGGRG